MRVFMYAIFDSCSKVYDRPWVARSDGEAMRSFGDIANDFSHPIGKHPEHFSCFRIGLFDDNTGEIVAENPSCIARAHELVKGPDVPVRYADSPEDAHGFVNGDDIGVGGTA